MTVVAPPEARAVVAEWAAAGLAAYGDDGASVPDSQRAETADG